MRKTKAKTEQDKKSVKTVSKKSIKTKLQIHIAVLAVTISVLCGSVSSFLLYKDSMGGMENRIRESTAAYSQSVNNAINIYTTQMEAVAQNTAITNPLLTERERRMAMDNLAQKYGFESISVANEQGVTSESLNVKGYEYFQRAMDGDTYISTTMRTDTSNKTVLVATTPLRNGGAYKGIVIATLNGDTFSDMIDEVIIGKSGYAFIVDKEGKAIAHRDREKVEAQLNYIEAGEKDKSGAEVAGLVQNMTSGKTGMEQVHYQGKRLSVGYSTIPSTDGWSIGVVAYSSEMMDDFYLSVILTMILIAFFVAGSILVALRIANPIVNPIIGMVGRLQLLAQGDLHSEVPQYNSEDEIGALSSSLTQTVHTLSEMVNGISRILGELEQGNCTVEMRINYIGDFVELKNALQGIISNLNRTFLSFKTSIHQVATGADQVSAGAQSLASGAAEQAATIEQLNASVSGIAEQAQQNADNVRMSTEHITQAVEGVSLGNAHMQKLQTAMDEIAVSSDKISGITKAINDIAFQTNILALNAAVEAARAGESGKGFAVVADEVRNLAAKSAEAAEQTAKLIQHSTETVEDGKRLSNETAEMLKDVAEKAMLVEQTSHQIEAASEHQTRAIEEINAGLQQVSAVVQTNAATAEQSSASSEELAAQAESMRDEIARFNLKETTNNLTGTEQGLEVNETKFSDIFDNASQTY